MSEHRRRATARQVNLELPPAAALVLFLLFASLEPADAAAGFQFRTRERRKSTAVTLTEYMGVQYHGDLTIGGQTLKMIYDTGSYDIVALSTICGNCQAKTAIYDPAKSSTIGKVAGAEMQLYFGSGPVTVKEYTESIAFGDQGTQLVLKKAPFWQVLEHDLEPWKAPGGASFAGIVGLPMIRDSPNRPGSADETVLTLLQVQRFAICLGSIPTSPGYLTFDPELSMIHLQPGFKTVNIVGEVHWGVTLSNVALGDTTADAVCSPTCAAIVDSGTSMIGAPPEAIGALGKILKTIATDCSNLAELPDLKFRLGDQDFALPPEGYVLKTYDGLSCMPAFQLVELTSDFGPIWLLGYPFFRFHYVVFQRSSSGEKKLHIGAGQECGPTPPTPGASGAAQLTRHRGAGVHSANFTAARLPGWATGSAPFRL